MNRWLKGKVPDAGKDWGQKENRASEDEMANGITDATDMELAKLHETLRDIEAWRAAVHGVTKSQTWLGNWTTTTKGLHYRLEMFPVLFFGGSDYIGGDQGSRYSPWTRTKCGIKKKKKKTLKIT